MVALTPYSFEALDALTGYEAGMPNPGFYDLAWRDEDPARAALQLVVGELRRRGQHVSPADLIGVESTARGLALIRGHARVWRGDLLDGILGALVKDELELGVSHPMLDAAHAVLRGGARGKLADGVSRPPFVAIWKRRWSVASWCRRPWRGPSICGWRTSSNARGCCTGSSCWGCRGSS